ncbi:MAG: ribonuclease R [Rhodospirillales bacterium]|nr:ribonuclease R [Alphaproteobacteria bacterium]MCB9986360.1 ribonuclease R [Rhodospirillales bacterium]USO07091.1 MAG: ribonuclease R [Rhodospirillales bacterium]
MTKPPLTPDALIAAIENAGRPVTRRDLARAFGLKDHEKIPLKKLLKELVGEGQIEQLPAKTYALAAPRDADGPAVAILRISEITLDGDVFAQPVETEKDLPARIALEPAHHEHDAPGLGDRILAQIRHHKDGDITARIVRRLGKVQDRLVLGRVVRAGAVWRLQPVHRKERDEYQLDVPASRQPEMEHGALVEAFVDEGAKLSRPRARLHAIIGHDDDPKAISLIALHEKGLRIDFPAGVVSETEGMTVPPLGAREDLRAIPLVTIDGADARDFDDAVFAQKQGDGYHLIVAIADVAHYVRPGSALDREAYKRGNSTYFPDRVLPMLPEKLSNDLCSLRPDGDRACLAVHMSIDAAGELKTYKFVRGLMRSAARLTYEQVQDALNGAPDAVTDPLMDTVIRPLYAAFKILDAARARRGALDLDMPERKVVVDAKGDMTGVALRPRYDSHKLIEEFMILANVAAARALEAKTAPCIYRIHDQPSGEKIDGARAFLEGFGLNLAKGQVVRPQMFNGLLDKVRGLDHAPLVNQIVLRAQSQAVYSPENIGHFGLGLQKYAHFTSPIRRYADLIVHRSLIRAYGLGDGGLEEGETHRLAETADHISLTERASMEAERAAVDRFTAAFLARHLGQVFSGRISGVTRFGLFVTLDETGADGLVPIRTLPPDYYVHSEDQHALIGRRTGRLFRLCAPVRVMVVDADRLTGSTAFELVGAEDGADVPGYQGRKPHLRAMPKSVRGHGGNGGRGPGRGGKRREKPGKKGKKPRR